MHLHQKNSIHSQYLMPQQLQMNFILLSFLMQSSSELAPKWFVMVFYLKVKMRHIYLI